MDATRVVVIPCSRTRLRGELAVPPVPRGLVVFAGSRPSIRSSTTARALALQVRDDVDLVAQSRSPRARLRAASELVVVAGARDEPATLNDVARRASAWFARNVG